MRPRFDERSAEVWITNLPFERLTQRVAVQCYAEAFLVEALRNGPDRYFWKAIDFFYHSLPQFGCKTRCGTMLGHTGRKRDEALDADRIFCLKWDQYNALCKQLFDFAYLWNRGSRTVRPWPSSTAA